MEHNTLMETFDPIKLSIRLSTETHGFSRGVNITAELWYDGKMISKDYVSITKSDIDSDTNVW
jgi:hypothetical protein